MLWLCYNPMSFLYAWVVLVWERGISFRMGKLGFRTFGLILGGRFDL